MTEYVSRNALAKEFGLDKRTVGAAVAAAGITRTARGFDADAARAAVALGVDVTLVAGHAASGRGNLVAAGATALNEAKAERERQTVRKIKLANDRAEGLLVSRDVVRHEIEDIGTALKQSVLSIATRIAPRLVNIQDARQARILLHAELEIALNQTEHRLNEVSETYGSAAA